jgi:Tfp pilus assembly protein PilF
MNTMNLLRIVIVGSLAVLLLTCASATLPLPTPPGSNAVAAQHNAEGMAHYEMGHWSVARDHFVSAIETDPNLAESHFNLALALDKLDLHAEAKRHFKKAAELAPGNSAITQSSAYRSHTTTSSIYGPSSYGGMGGY